MPIQKSIIIQKAIKTQVFFNYPGDLTNKIVTFRFKKLQEDSTAPLIEGNVILIEATETKSRCYFYIDLSQTNELKALAGRAWVDFSITFDGDPCPTITFPTPIEIVTTLKGY